MTSIHPLRDSGRLAGLLAEAGDRARTIGRRVLVSVTERASMGAGDLLRLFDRAGRERRFPEMMYWERPSEQFALAGFGATLAFRDPGHARFRDTDQAWAALLEDAVVEDDSEGAAGVGPVLMGGFAFDPSAARRPEWRDFPSAGLVLPRILLSVVGGACFLTATAVVSPEGEPDLDADTITGLRAGLLASGDAFAGAPADDESLHARRDIRFADVRSPQEWNDLVSDAVQQIVRGEMEKVVVARAVHATALEPFDLHAALHRLRAAHPDCYVFACRRGESVFLGASPERLVRLDGRDVQASSLAGSTRRGTSAEEDAALAAALLASPKDRAEHAVVRRALCAALGQLCDSVTAATEPSLLSLANVHHLHTAVRARLRPGRSLLELLAQLHPTPAVGGEPREPALAFIREHEGLDRGWYAGPVGWLGRRRGEFAVALRSALVRHHEAWLFAGCGIVADSDPDDEYAESQVKLRPMKAALA